MGNASGVGEYTVASLADETVCRVHVADTTPPELTVTDIAVFQGEDVAADDFVESCSDLAGEVEVRLVTEPDVNTLGRQTMTIEATDPNGNTTTATATLAVVRDKTPPVIKGLTTLSVAKHFTPDYLVGVRAVDAGTAFRRVDHRAARYFLFYASDHGVSCRSLSWKV